MAAPFKTVLIVGATGHLGLRVLDEFLTQGGYDVHVLARPIHKDHDEQGKILDTYAGRGVKVYYIELDDHAQLSETLKGIDVILSFLSGPALSEQIKIINAAHEAGVRRFVPSEYGISATMPEDAKLPLRVAKQSVVRAIKDSGLEYTLFTNGIFLDTEELPWGIGKTFINGDQIAIPGDGQAKISWIHRYNIAQYVVASLASPVSKNAELTFVGDVWTWNEIVDFIEDLYSIKFDRRYLTVAELQQLVANPPHPEAIPLLHAQLAHATGALYIDRPNNNAQFPNVKPITFPSYFANLFRQHLVAAGVPEALFNKGVQSVASNSAAPINPDFNKGVQGVTPAFNKGVQGVANSLAAPINPEFNKGVQGVTPDFNKGVQGVASSSAAPINPNFNKGVQGVAGGLAAPINPEFNKGVQGVTPNFNKGVQGVTPDFNKGVQGVASSSAAPINPEFNKGVQGVTPDFNKGVQGVASSSASPINPEFNKGVQGVTPDFNKGVQGVASSLTAPINPEFNNGAQGVTPDFNKGVQGVASSSAAPINPEFNMRVQPDFNKGVQGATPELKDVQVAQTKSNTVVIPNFNKGVQVVIKGGAHVENNSSDVVVNPDFNKGVQGAHQDFNKGVQGEHSDFNKGVQGEHSDFNKGVQGEHSDFNKGVQGEHSDFNKGVQGEHSDFNKGVQGEHSDFNKGVQAGLTSDAAIVSHFNKGVQVIVGPGIQPIVDPNFNKGVQVVVGTVKVDVEPKFNKGVQIVIGDKN